MDIMQWSVRNYLMFNVLSTLRFPLSGIICIEAYIVRWQMVLKNLKNCSSALL